MSNDERISAQCKQKQTVVELVTTISMGEDSWLTHESSLKWRKKFYLEELRKNTVSISMHNLEFLEVFIEGSICACIKTAIGFWIQGGCKIKIIVIIVIIIVK